MKKYEEDKGKPNLVLGLPDEAVEFLLDDTLSSIK